MSENVKTWGQALDWVWSTHWRRLASAKTNQINSGHLTAYCGRSMPLARMAKGAWWTEAISELQDEHPQWSTGTVNRVISAGTTVLRKCHRAGLTEIAVPLFDRLVEGEHRHTWFTKPQVESLAFAATDVFHRQDLSDALLFAAYTGARQGESLKIKVEDIDWSLNNIWFGGRPGRVTKSKKVRNVPIHSRIAPLLRQRCEHAAPNTRLFGDDWNNKDQLYNAFKKVRSYVGISEDYCWHTLRHSFATWAGEAGHPRDVMALLGHSQITTTLKYCKATDAALRSTILAI